MSKALENTLEKLKQDRELARQTKQWEGKAHYFSPKTAEKWDVPEHLMRFETNSTQEMRRVVTQYTSALASELDTKSVGEVLQERRIRSRFSDWKDGSKSRLSDFDEVFRVAPDDADAPKKKRGLLAKLFGRK